ncbi:MAG: S-ribosylhomocysteine lyase [Clostridiales bacterium]|nr:S-ribosylhomocysteine lyase [Clostridiales bacterium]
MERIASFSVDHNKLKPGMYLSRVDGDVVTYDLRFKVPNSGDLLSNAELHSAEHLLATLLRNSEHRDAVIYFGPMGCQTGFYLLVDGRQLDHAGAIGLMREVCRQGAGFTGEMPGKSAAECGNFRNLDLELAKRLCRFYGDLIRDWTVDRLSYES